MYTEFPTFRILKKTLVLVYLLAGCAFWGCGGSSLPQLSGTVTVNGTPAVGALVIYHPQGDGKVATGVADAEGKYQLVTDAEVGVTPGKYQVTVTWPDPNHKQEAGSLLSQASSEPGPDVLKGKFAKKEASGLSAEITASTKELQPIALTTK
ncbi:MAG: carboxypeptidase-like regulatory domain-containing protein [Pirellula sp.]|nr:carboxypeptidase-like regulatory domain-containing protein [Pirellula sp.]